MEKTQHLFEERVYLISNHSVARNPMFSSEEMQLYFAKRMEHYLTPICDILAYNLKDDEFQLLVKLKKREDFEKYFKQKMKSKKKFLQDVPESTYIFSQAMANLQVSFVKHFNWKYGRSGTLVARRFGRKLVESESEMQEWISKLNGGEKLHNYREMWINDLMKSRVEWTSLWMYGGAAKPAGVGLEKITEDFIGNLVGSFNHPMQKKLDSSKNYFLYQFNRLFGPNINPEF